ncbi:MAG: alpha-amylase family glycosyl hydrolase [Thermosynechococcaceae cyanobacterium MS004]|nr:alpha-amylase family glycosyl hydrolase [Thermosynechococcaceae cyanobacterium MS004]
MDISREIFLAKRSFFRLSNLSVMHLAVAVASSFIALSNFNRLPVLATTQSGNNFVYQIFVRSWADTPKDTDEIGDLKGIREKLDYLNDGRPATDNDLEVGILWLMPVFPSKSYHGYDVTDFRTINPDYGTLQDFKDLIADAHQRGMRIILDIPFNHTSDQHPWFKEAVDNPNSRFRKFYHFADINQPAPPGSWHVATGSNGQKVRYLGLFSPNMPDLDLNQPEVQKEIKGIAKFWLDNGIDGFRLDAAKHIFGDTFNPIPETDILRNNDWWRSFSDFVYQNKKNAVLVGEVLGDKEMLRRHAYGLDALIDEPFMEAARTQISFPSTNFLTTWKNFVNSARTVNQIAHQRAGSQRKEPFQPFIYLASHDKSPRLASDLEEKKRLGMKPSIDEAYRLGMYILTTLGKYPILYNGDEVMQRGFKWNGNPPNDSQSPGDGSGLYDETLREPFPWLKGGDSPIQGDNDMQTSWSKLLPKFDKPNDGVSVEEQTAPKQMLNLIRGLTNLRTSHPSYANGELGDILTDTSDWLVFEKKSGQERYLVLINSTDTGLDYNFSQEHFPRYINSQLIFFSDGKSKEWKDKTNANKRINTKVFVPSYGLVVLKQVQN